jgi:hypothetical protein
VKGTLNNITLLGKSNQQSPLEEENDLKTGFQSMQGTGSGGNCSGCCEVNLSLF